VVFRLESCLCFSRVLCFDQFISAIYYYMCHEVFAWLRVYFIHSSVEHRACSILATPGV